MCCILQRKYKIILGNTTGIMLKQYMPFIDISEFIHSQASTVQTLEFFGKFFHFSGHWTRSLSYPLLKTQNRCLQPFRANTIIHYIYELLKYTHNEITDKHALSYIIGCRTPRHSFIMIIDDITDHCVMKLNGIINDSIVYGSRYYRMIFHENIWYICTAYTFDIGQFKRDNIARSAPVNEYMDDCDLNQLKWDRLLCDRPVFLNNGGKHNIETIINFIQDMDIFGYVDKKNKQVWKQSIDLLFNILYKLQVSLIDFNDWKTEYIRDKMSCYNTIVETI